MTKPERAQFIYAKIRSALRAIQTDPKYDWNRDFSDAIGTAAETLGKALQKFVDGKSDETSATTTTQATWNDVGSCRTLRGRMSQFGAAAMEHR